MDPTRSAGAELGRSIDGLARVAAAAGLHPEQAREEGLVVAAALSESVPGAARDWVQVGAPGTTDLGEVNGAFFDAASRGRRWREHPTELLSALVDAGDGHAVDYARALTEVAAAACSLGEPTIRATANASVAAAAYLEAAGEAVRTSPRPGFAHPSQPPGKPLEPVDSGAQPASAAEATTTTAHPAQPPEPEKGIEELLGELDALVGLARVKREIHRQVALLTVERMRVAAGLRQPRISRHLVFVGNPGTGKTSVARLVGGIYRALGLLDQGQLVEVDRSELVAGYVGQTAMKTAEVVAKAAGGVLFVDEAYSLTGDEFAREAVNTLVKEMEDRRDDLVVVVAGYPEPMVGFITSNPGLASRFTTTIEFDDYTDEELMAILKGIAAQSDYELTPDAERRVRDILQATPRTPAFGNGRFVRNLFEAAIGRHAWRVKDEREPTRDLLRLLTAGDFIEEAEGPPAVPTDPVAEQGGAQGGGPDGERAAGSNPVRESGTPPEPNSEERV
jgi:hypothetical protein